MDRVSIRELRNDVSRVVRRARSGERLVVTVNGVPAAQLGPLEPGISPRTMDELIAAGAVEPPRTRARARPAKPVRFDGELTTDDILRRHRDRA